MATRTDRLQKRAPHFDPDEIEGIHFVTPEEGRAMFDREAQKTLGISGEEFLRRWDSGEYRPVPDDTEGRKFGRLAMMIPFARRTPA
ncbi:MAG: hypothetical protein H0T18_02560 [Chloroflexia bacterium]|nr:hypothetical protein [Chloroflexia bacterium]